MTRTKVLLVAIGIVALGAVQLARFYGDTGRAGGIGTASAMIALLSGLAIGVYGITMRSRS